VLEEFFDLLSPFFRLNSLKVESNSTLAEF